jgi:hypothetical protein
MLKLNRTLLLTTVAAFALLAPALRAQVTETASKNTCLECHSTLEDDASKQFVNDIHYDRGLTCASCHGGDPTAEDMPDAMNPAKGFIGVPKRAQIPQLCAHCHSDAAFMRSYNPSLRTDQLSQYRTSIHGQRLQRGDTRVAVCSDCHGHHGILPASSPLSRVYPANIPKTCAACHADKDHMAPYKISTDQYAGYTASVHYKTLEGGDLSAPTCATCHGNHGAAPPGVASVERVCGTCHVFQERLFNESPHATAWESMGLATCITCHGNHRIEHPTDARIGTGDEAFCVNCHVEGDPGWQGAAQMHTDLVKLDSAIKQAGAILDQAERAGMEVGEARVTEGNAHEQLIKARVEIHAFNPARIDAITSEGMKVAEEAHQEGVGALAELAYRRKGLAASLIVIALVVLSLWMLIRTLERRKPIG